MIMFKSQHNSDRTVFDAVSIVSWSEIDVSNSISTFVSDPHVINPSGGYAPLSVIAVSRQRQWKLPIVAVYTAKGEIRGRLPARRLRR